MSKDRISEEEKAFLENFDPGTTSHTVLLGYQEWKVPRPRKRIVVTKDGERLPPWEIAKVFGKQKVQRRNCGYNKDGLRVRSMYRREKAELVQLVNNGYIER